MDILLKQQPPMKKLLPLQINVHLRFLTNLKGGLPSEILSKTCSFIPNGFSLNIHFKQKRPFNVPIKSIHKPNKSKYLQFFCTNSHVKKVFGPFKSIPSRKTAGSNNGLHCVQTGLYRNFQVLPHIVDWLRSPIWPRQATPDAALASCLGLLAFVDAFM